MASIRRIKKAIISWEEVKSTGRATIEIGNSKRTRENNLRKIK